MRRFVPNGPEIPLPVLHALEEERLVLFCGAGISIDTYDRPMDFPGLVRLVAKDCLHDIAPKPELAATTLDHAFYKQAYDQCLDLLERKHSRAVVRQKVVKILGEKPKRGAEKAPLHEALLHISSLSSGGHHLVTTNFDNRFDLAPLKTPYVSRAPEIRTPRLGQWKSLTYLHGKIDSKSDPEADDLILTSGDFGRAYLTDGWASRFLVELFRNYTVLFIGYSVTDPVMRYILDALVTDTKEGRFRQAYAMAGYKDGHEDWAVCEWKSKKIEAIPFSTGHDESDFSLQSDTLIAWGNEQRDHLNSRISIVRAATTKPYFPTPDDYDLKNITWALSKSDASVAKAFADMEKPVPDISWLRPLIKQKFQREPSRDPVSLLSMPAELMEVRQPDGSRLPRDYQAPLAGPGAACIPNLQINSITLHLGRWLARHLDKQELIDWVCENGGTIHPNWQRYIRDELKDLKQPYRQFWELIISDVVRRPCGEFDDYRFDRSLMKGKWPAGGWQAVMAAVRAWVSPEKPFHGLRDDLTEPTRLGDLASFKLKLVGEDFLFDLAEASESQDIRKNLASMADDLTSALVSALTMAGHADIHGIEQWNYLDVLSIAGGRRNASRTGWVSLVFLVRASFDASIESSREEAERLLQRWMSIHHRHGYSLLKRLIAYGLAVLPMQPSATILNGLLANNGELLWDYNAWPEAALLIRTKTAELTKTDRAKLIRAINAGPSRQRFVNLDYDDKEFADFAASRRKQRLRKLAQANITLPARLAREVANNPQFFNQTTDDETHHGVEVTSRPMATAEDLEGQVPEDIAKELLSGEKLWDAGPILADYVAKNLDMGIEVIRLLVAMDCPRSIFSVGFGGFEKSADTHVKRGRVLDFFTSLSKDGLMSANLASALSNLLGKLSKKINGRQQSKFFTLMDRVWDAVVIDEPQFDDNGPDQTNHAINAPGGHLAEALVARLFAGKPKVGSGIPKAIKQRLEVMWNGDSEAHRMARIIFASRLLLLSQLDRNWAKINIISAMESGPDRAALWNGFLWPAQADLELIKDLEHALASLLEQPQDIGEKNQNRLAEWTASAFIHGADLIGDKTKRTFFANATTDMLSSVGWYLERILVDAKEGAPKAWENRVKPLVEEYWPTNRAKVTPQISERLLDIALAARSAFPDVVAVAKRKILLVSGADGNFAYRLDRQQRDQGEDDDFDPIHDHAEVVLDALALTIDVKRQNHHMDYLRRVLQRIIAARPGLENRAEYRQLNAFAARG